VKRIEFYDEYNYNIYDPNEESFPGVFGGCYFSYSNSGSLSKCFFWNPTEWARCNGGRGICNHFVKEGEC